MSYVRLLKDMSPREDMKKLLIRISTTVLIFVMLFTPMFVGSGRGAYLVFNASSESIKQYIVSEYNTEQSTFYYEGEVVKMNDDLKIANRSFYSKNIDQWNDNYYFTGTNLESYVTVTEVQQQINEYKDYTEMENYFNNINGMAKEKVLLPNIEDLRSDDFQKVLDKFGTVDNAYETYQLIFKKQQYSTKEVTDEDAFNLLLNSNITQEQNKVDTFSSYSISSLEKKYCVFHYPTCSKAKKLSTTAANSASAKFYGQLIYDNGDAYRHSAWSALMASQLGYTASREIGCRHESLYSKACGINNTGYKKGTLSYNDKYMDLYNNAKGRDQGEIYDENKYYKNKYGSLLNWQYQEVISGKRKIVRKFTSSNKYCSQSNGQYYTGLHNSSGQCKK